ncbi:hypothetical protein AALP_AA8G152200 [Arabis alpina]|uniref:valine--tRNA ligase n=1 Tax=Arabis alpina TaxID=50452 RepID=A0A087G778_ARAAL|nr:hypothetical protein AALP_AA8G152200 [Arabis alpina]
MHFHHRGESPAQHSLLHPASIQALRNVDFPCLDIMVRYNRMKGRPTLWLPGTDHTGIATQVHFPVQSSSFAWYFY